MGGILSKVGKRAPISDQQQVQVANPDPQHNRQESSLDRIPLAPNEHGRLFIELTGKAAVIAAAGDTVTLFDLALRNPKLFFRLANRILGGGALLASMKRNCIILEVVIEDEETFNYTIKSIIEGRMKEWLNQDPKLNKAKIMFDSVTLLKVEPIPMRKSFGELREVAEKKMRQMEDQELSEEQTIDEIVFCDCIQPYPEATYEEIEVQQTNPDNPTLTRVTKIKVFRRSGTDVEKSQISNAEVSATLINVYSEPASPVAKTAAQPIPADADQDEALTAKDQLAYTWKDIKALLASIIGRDEISAIYRGLTNRNAMEVEQILEDIKQRSRKEFFYAVFKQLEKELGSEFTPDLLKNHFIKEDLKYFVEVITKCVEEQEARLDLPYKKVAMSCDDVTNQNDVRQFSVETALQHPVGDDEPRGGRAWSRGTEQGEGAQQNDADNNSQEASDAAPTGSSDAPQRREEVAPRGTSAEPFNTGPVSGTPGREEAVGHKFTFGILNSEEDAKIAERIESRIKRVDQTACLFKNFIPPGGAGRAKRDKILGFCEACACVLWIAAPDLKGYDKHYVQYAHHFAIENDKKSFVVLIPQERLDMERESLLPQPSQPFSTLDEDDNFEYIIKEISRGLH